MKKALVTMFALGLMVVVAAPAFAADLGSGLYTFGQSSGIYCTYGLSNNVVMTYTPGDSGQSYALGDKHKAGNREFYTTNMTTNIYYIEDNTYKGLASLSGTMPTAGAATVSGMTAL